MSAERMNDSADWKEAWDGAEGWTGWCLNLLPVLKFCESSNFLWDLNNSIFCDLIHQPELGLIQGGKAKHISSFGLLGEGLWRRKQGSFGETVSFLPPGHLPSSRF